MIFWYIYSALGLQRTLPGWVCASFAVKMAALAHSPALLQAAAVAAAAVAAKAAEKNIRDRAGQAAAALPDNRARAVIAFLFPGGRSAAGASAIGSNLFVGFGCGLPAGFFGSFSGRSVALGPRADADTRLVRACEKRRTG